MLFNSYIFVLVFLPVFLILYFVVRKASYNSIGLRDACRWIIAAGSFVFYVPFGLRNTLVLIVSIALGRIMTYLISSAGNTGSGSGGTAGAKSSRQKLLFAAGLFINIGSLLFFKFSGSFFPVAVSFYTFNQISLLVDIYRGDARFPGLADYLSYILFFPKLLQGPLMGFDEFGEKLERALKDKLSFENLLRGLLLFSMGLFKKVILADTFGKAVDYGFDNIISLGSLEAVLVAVFYSFQLYFDFSGYCDAAMGISMMMGFDLPMNFNSPYKAVSIVDFWKRWHITLTRFFTKYVYIPLGGNRRGRMRMYLNYMAVFLLSGLWHGNGITFVIWGAIHGGLYVITKAAMSMHRDSAMKTGTSEKEVSGEMTVADRAPHKVLISGISSGVKVIFTFILVTAAWVFFRARTVKEAFSLFMRVIEGGKKPITTQLSSVFQLDEIWYVIKVTPIMRFNFAWDICLWLFVIAAAAIVFFFPSAADFSKNCRLGVKTTLLTAILLVWSILSFAGVSTFLYMNF
ncbi:MAG: MBOAT family protein [Butyrivibrio sp.]|nr:MBOAT family protein [Butyrivibrio sp.]